MRGESAQRVADSHPDVSFASQSACSSKTARTLPSRLLMPCPIGCSAISGTPTTLQCRTWMSTLARCSPNCRARTSRTTPSSSCTRIMAIRQPHRTLNPHLIRRHPTFPLHAR
eukprot:3573607-Prymnesium_polylepis.1